MTTTVRTGMFIGVMALVVGAAVGPRLLYAQTPAQIEAERVRQLQIDNARRAQEESARAARESSRAIREWSPSTPGAPSSPSSGSATPHDICKAKPVRAGERNLLIGRWRYVGPQAGRADMVSEKQLGLTAANYCLIFRGGFDFREKSIMGRDKEIAVHYGRDGDVWWFCTDDVSQGFRVADLNRLNMVDPMCAFDRVDASPSDGGKRL